MRQYVIDVQLEDESMTLGRSFARGRRLLLDLYDASLNLPEEKQSLTNFFFKLLSN
jgi:hypothetical protein